VLTNGASWRFFSAAVEERKTTYTIYLTDVLAAGSADETAVIVAILAQCVRRSTDLPRL
jgi:hypothetical protein